MIDNEKEIDLVALAKMLWQERKKLVKWAAIGFVVGLVVAISLPNEYKSSIKVAPETKSGVSIASQIGGLAAMVGMSTAPNSEDGIDETMYPEIVKSSIFLNEFENIEVPFENGNTKLITYLTKEQKKAWWKYVINAPSAFVGWIFSPSADEVVDSAAIRDNQLNPSAAKRSFEQVLAGRISIVKEKKTGLLTMDVKMQSPEVAAIVADSLLQKLQRYMTNYYTAKSRQDLKMNQLMLWEAKRDYYTVDSLYAVTADKNQSIRTKSAQAMVDRYKDERDIAFSVYQQMASQVGMLKIKLQEDTPIATVIEPARLALRPSEPRKMLLVMGFIFMLVTFKSAAIVLHGLSKQKEE